MKAPSQSQSLQLAALVLVAFTGLLPAQDLAFQQVAAGFEHTVGLQSDGTLWP